MSKVTIMQNLKDLVLIVSEKKAIIKKNSNKEIRKLTPSKLQNSKMVVHSWSNRRNQQTYKT